jgi:hypothetical protein
LSLYSSIAIDVNQGKLLIAKKKRQYGYLEKHRDTMTDVPATVNQQLNIATAPMREKRSQDEEVTIFPSLTVMVVSL